MTIYTPDTVPSSAEELPEYLERELLRLADALRHRLDLDNTRQADVPRPTEGMVRWFDTSVYDPGQGTGLYVYVASGWVRILGSADIDRWVAQGTEFDLVPTTDDQWVGDADQMPRGVAVGKPTGDPATPGIQGVLVDRSGAQDGFGGAAVVGYVTDDVRAGIPDPGTLANAPVEISGNIVLVAGAPFFEVLSPIVEEHYVIAGQSITLADGRHFSPLLLGGRYVPSVEEFFTDTNTFDLDLLPIIIFPGGAATFTNAFAAGDTSFSWEVTITEESSRSSLITVEIWYDDGGGFVLAATDDYPMSGNSRIDVSVSLPITQAIAIGDVVEMRVSAVKDNPNSDPRVRGDLKQTRIGARQG